tara:strand:+ start:18860 stop:19675 length:816 start_codon:yes stop_codon:yes gene_type:complete
MKLFKFSNFIGVFTGILFLVSAVGFSADEPMAFINFPGLLIVLGGTMTAMLISFPFSEVLAALKQGKVVTESLNRDFSRETKQILHFSTLWFRKQYAMIDRDLERLDSPFLKKGLQMVRDGQSSDDVISLLNWSISQIRAKESAVINIFRSMATFAPAFGMVGSLVGLVNMLQTIETGNLSAVSSDMGVALVTTFYGLLLANLVFKPIATKLEQRRHLKIIQLTMMAEGVALIQQQRTPSAIRDVLVSFMLEQEQSTTNSVSKPMMTRYSV